MDILKENFSNLNRIWQMAVISVREDFRDAKLGILWEVLRVAVFFTVYTMFFVFVRGAEPGFLFGFLSVLLPFNLVMTVINQTPRTYKRNGVLVTSIKFPIGIITIYDIVSKLIIHLITVVIVTIVFVLLNHISITFIQVLYYYICLIYLLIGMMFILSMLCSISDDFFKLWQVITRVFMYLNPIFWSIDWISNIDFVKEFPIIIDIIKYGNPFVYILEGFREIVGKTENYSSFSENHLELFNVETLVFWVSATIIFIIGLRFQSKLRRILPDVI